MAQPTPASLSRPTDAARQLFERDWVLMNWALKYYDRDRDILLEPDEAQSAAEAFRRIADAMATGGSPRTNIAPPGRLFSPVIDGAANKAEGRARPRVP